MKEFKLRYRLNPTDSPKPLAVQTRSLDDAIALAFRHIDVTHQLYTFGEREQVELDDGTNLADPFAPETV